PKYDRTENTPEQHLVIIFLVDLEVLQDQEDHESIVNGKRVFRQIGRKILNSTFGTTLIIKQNKHPEQRGNEHPEDRLIEGRLCTDLMGLFVKQAQIEHQEKNNDYRKYSKQYCFLFGQITKQRECKYIEH